MPALRPGAATCPSTPFRSCPPLPPGMSTHCSLTKAVLPLLEFYMSASARSLGAQQPVQVPMWAPMAGCWRLQLGRAEHRSSLASWGPFGCVRVGPRGQQRPHSFSPGCRNSYINWGLNTAGLPLQCWRPAAHNPGSFKPYPHSIALGMDAALVCAASLGCVLCHPWPLSLYPPLSIQCDCI